MGSFEEQVHKELKSKNINNKNYLWVISFVILISCVTYYSYKHDMGVIAKHSIDKEFMVKNQTNLDQLYQENLNNPEQRYQDEYKPKSLYDAVIVANTTPEHEEIEEDELTQKSLEEGPEVNVNDEEIAANDIPMTTPEVQQNLPQDIKSAQNVAKVEPVIKEEKAKVIEATSNKTVAQSQKNTEKGASIVAFSPEPKKEFSIIKCYNLQSNQASISAVCKNRINLFLQGHKAASKFEVIGIIDLIDEKEVIKHNKYKNVYFLGKERVKRAKALIQKNLGEKVSILPHEYTLKTELENRGVVIRAYN